MTKRHISLILCLLISIAAIAQRGESATLELSHSDNGTCNVFFSLGNLSMSVTPNGTTLQAEGMVSLAPREGLPALPQMSRLLTLPQGSVLQLERWQEGEPELFALPQGAMLTPWQGATVKDAESLPVGPDKEVYSSASFVRNGAPIAVENLGVMGDRQVFRLTVNPCAYNPATGEVRLSKNISATLTIGDANPLSYDSRIPQRYLIVSRPQFHDGLQPFVQWKRQEGFDVEELYADTNSRNDVKAMIDDAGGDGLRKPWPHYILIVGDAAMIQAFVGTVRPSGLSSHPTDLYYADYTGDYLPDAAIGRWPVNDTAELRAVVEKTLLYERGLNLDTAALHRVLLVAGRENTDPAPTTTNGQVNYLKNAFAQEGLDTLCYYNPASSGQRAEILSDIGNGVGLLNYTAHCTTAGWSNPAVTFASVDTLSAMPMVYVNNCCQSNDFSGTCFGEQLLRKPQGGGVAVIGATNSTLWNEDYYWSVGPKYPFSLNPQYDSLRQGAFDRLLSGEAVTAGELLVAGNLAVSAFGSPYDRFYWEIYTLFGDPALVPWIGVSESVSLWVPDTIAVGTMELRVSGTPGALVSAVQGGELLGVVRLDQHRSSLLRLRRATDTLPVLFTATKPRMLPLEMSIPSAMPQGKAVAFTDVTLGEGQVSFTIVNFGTDTLYGVDVTLTEADSGTMYASFTSNTMTFATLPPQASHTTYLPFHIDRWAPQLAASLTATDTNGDRWCLTLGIPLSDMWPELTFGIRNADTTVATEIQRNSSYLVGATPTGYYDTLHVGATSLPEAVTFENNGGWLPVTVGDSATHLQLTGHIGRGNYSRSYEYYLNVGGSRDGFGNGMNAYPWQTGGTLPWTVDSTVSHSGRYSLRSGAIDYRQTSDLLFEVLLPAADSIAFWLRPSTEPNYDKLVFTIDGVKAMETWGESPWKRYSYILHPGRHTLRWRYSKDESTSQGSDCVWIDDIRLPFALWTTPCGQHADDNGVTGIGTLPEVTSRIVLKPNPSRGDVTIDAGGSVIDCIRIVDLYGHTILATTPSKSHCKLELASLPNGIYIVEMHTEHSVTRAKLNLQHP